ncbi:MAG: hypothetical protein RL077_1799 [Verrucomicrobiota bacterium]
MDSFFLRPLRGVPSLRCNLQFSRPKPLTPRRPGKTAENTQGGLRPSPNQTGGLGSYSFVPIPLSRRALLPFIMKQSSENIVTRYRYRQPGAGTLVNCTANPPIDQDAATILQLTRWLRDFDNFGFGERPLQSQRWRPLHVYRWPVARRVPRRRRALAGSRPARPRDRAHGGRRHRHLRPRAHRARTISMGMRSSACVAARLSSDPTRVDRAAQCHEPHRRR